MTKKRTLLERRSRYEVSVRRAMRNAIVNANQVRADMALRAGAGIEGAITAVTIGTTGMEQLLLGSLAMELLERLDRRVRLSDFDVVKVFTDECRDFVRQCQLRSAPADATYKARLTMWTQLRAIT